MKFNKSVLALAITTGLLAAQVTAQEVDNTTEAETKDVEVIEVRGVIRGSIVNSQ
jgi:hypothetical protein